MYKFTLWYVVDFPYWMVIEIDVDIDVTCACLVFLL